MKTAERYKEEVAALGCILCKSLGLGYKPAQLHHPRTGQGMAQRASDFLVIPLCPDCHQGQNGIHGDRALLRIAKVDEMDLLAMTIQAMQQ